MQIDIRTLDVLRGGVDRRALNEAPAWARDNHDLLLEYWEPLNG